MFSGCCPPLARPRQTLGGEIIGFDPKTGQFLQASAGMGATRIVDYPYYASAGTGRMGRAPFGAGPKTKAMWAPNRRRPLGDTTGNVLWVGIGALVVASLYVAGQALKESYAVERAG